MGNDHLSTEQLQVLLAAAEERVQVGAEYCHYKHPEKKYVVEALAFDEATEEPRVVYRALYEPGLAWIRTVDDFCAEVETAEGKTTRFSRLST